MAYKQIECVECSSVFEGWHSAKYCSDRCEWLANTIESTCNVCGEPFRGNPCNANKYCSKDCAGEARRKTEELECPHCGDTFKVQASDAEKRKYCSSKCAGEAHTPAVMEVRSCSVCDDTFEVSTASDKTYCSHECASESQRKYKTCEHCGDQFNNRDASRFCSFECAKQGLTKRYTKECPECGDEFETIPSVDKDHCSRECARSAAKAEPTVRTCQQCGEEYTNGNIKYCSKACYGKAQRVDPEQRDDLRKLKYAQGDDVHKDIPEMLEEQDGECVYCATDITDEHHLDHITPLARGGEHVRANAHLTCPFCNQQKAAYTHEEYIEYRRRSGMKVHGLAVVLE